MNCSIAPKDLRLDRAIVEEFDFPSFPGDRNFYHDRIVAMLVETVMDFPLAQVIQK